MPGRRRVRRSRQSRSRHALPYRRMLALLPRGFAQWLKRSNLNRRSFTRTWPRCCVLIPGSAEICVNLPSLIAVRAARTIRGFGARLRRSPVALLFADHAPGCEQLLRLQQRLDASSANCVQLALLQSISWYRREYALPVANLVSKCGVAQSCDSCSPSRCANYRAQDLRQPFEPGRLCLCRHHRHCPVPLSWFFAIQPVDQAISCWLLAVILAPAQHLRAYIAHFDFRVRRISLEFVEIRVRKKIRSRSRVLPGAGRGYLQLLLPFPSYPFPSPPSRRDWFRHRACTVLARCWGFAGGYLGVL